MSSPEQLFELPLFVTDESWDNFMALGFVPYVVLAKDEDGSEIGNRIPNRDSQEQFTKIIEEYGTENVKTGSPFTVEQGSVVVGPIEELSYPETTFGVYVRK